MTVDPTGAVHPTGTASAAVASAPDPIPLSEPTLDGNEEAYLRECVRSGFVSSVGPFVDRFEDAIATTTGADAAVALGSGTAALQLALVAAGVSSGAEVWVPSLTFIATANAVVHAGGRPVFVDAAPDGLHLDPDVVEGELRSRRRSGRDLPAAIVPVHVFGEPAPLPWLALARELGVAVIEDAAESLGSHWDAGDHTGTRGTLGCFSFNGNKIVTAGGGGAVVGDAATVARIRHLSTQARVAGTDDEHDEVGFNHRLTNTSAAVGLAQIERLGDFVAARRRHHASYAERLAGVAGMRVLPCASGANGWLTAIESEDATLAETHRSALHGAGARARAAWSPLHHQRPYADAPVLGAGRHAERWATTVTCLPSSAALRPDQVDRVVDALVGAIGSAPASEVWARSDAGAGVRWWKPSPIRSSI